MALVLKYNGIKDYEKIYCNGIIKDNFKSIDWNNTLLLKSGFKVKPEYELQENDIILMRKLPTSEAVIIGLVVGSLIIGGISLGVSLYNSRKVNEELQKAKKASKAAGERNTALPFIKGAKNQPATGQTFPYVIGETLFTPYRLCSPHIKIEGAKGEKQYFYTTLECGYNNLFIKKIKMGETVIKDFGSPNQAQNGTYAWDDGVYYDSENTIEIVQSGDFSDDNFNEKIIYTEVSSEIPHKHASDNDTPEDLSRITSEWQKGVVQELPNNATKVELFVLFDGLRKYDNDDGWVSCSVTLRPQWTEKNNPLDTDWHDFSQGFKQGATYSNTFTYNNKNTMRFSATQEFTGAQSYNENIKIRVIRTTPQEESNAKDVVYLQGVQTTCYDAKKSSTVNLTTARVLEEVECTKCCRIGFKIIANDNTTGLLDEIRVIEQGVAQVWNGTSWSQNKQPTKNLAAWVREILLSDKHTPSQYSTQELDEETFGAWYEYCDRQDFNADGVIYKPTKKKSIIDTLLGNGNAQLVYNPFTGKIEVAIDNGRDYSVAMLNSDNIIGISTTKEFKRKTDGVKVTYVNGRAGYDVDTVTFMKDGGEYDPQNDTLQTIGLEYITDYNHAYKYAWRKMAEELAQPRIMTVKVGMEAAYYPLFSRVEVQHKSLKIGLAQTTIKGLNYKSGLLKEIELSTIVDFPEDKACGVIINCVSPNSNGIASLKVNGMGKTNILEVITTLRSSADVLPAVGNSLSFGELDINGDFTTITNSMKITNVEESDNYYTLTLVDYNEDLYRYGELPEYKSNITTIPNNSKGDIKEHRNYITAEEVGALNSEVASNAAKDIGNEVVEVITDGLHFTNVHKIKDIDCTIEDLRREIDDVMAKANSGIQIAEESVTIQVQNTESSLVGLLEVTAENITSMVSDLENELQGLLEVTNSSVTALVQGGGASGHLALSLELPVVIDASTRAKFVQKSSEAEVSAVYALIENTEHYGIKGNASETVVKNLWQKAVQGNLLASQIDLKATQIQMKAENVVITDSNNYGQTIVQGGKIKTNLIDVDDLMAQLVTIKDGGSIQSQNFETSPTGFKISSDGNAIFNNGTFNGEVNATSGTFTGEINATSGAFTGVVNATIGTFENVNITNSTYEGDINAGPLQIYDPGGYGSFKIFPIGTITSFICNWVDNAQEKYNAGNYTFGLDLSSNSRYGNTPIDKIKCYVAGKTKRVWLYKNEIELFFISSYTSDNTVHETQYELVLDCRFGTGKIMILDLPSIDPYINGALYETDGIVKISKQ